MSHGFAGSGHSVTITGLDAVSAGTTLANSGTVQFVNSNGVSFGMDNGSITASVSAVGGGAALSAGTQSVNTGTVVFSNSNGISFGMSGSSQITASYTVPSTAGLISNVNISAGTTSNNLSALTFSDSNGVAFGLNGSVLTASYTQSTHSHSTAPGAIAAGTQTATTGTVVFSDSNGISFGMSGSSRITASYTVPSTAGLISNINVSAGTTSNNLSAITFSNSNGVSFGLNGSVVTASYTVPTVPAQLSVGDSTGGNTAGDTGVVTGRLVLVGGNNVTLSGSTNAGSMTLTVSGANTHAVQTGISAVVVSDATFTSGTVTFSNLNGISFGSNGANVVTASYTVPSLAGYLTNVNVSAGTTSNNLSAVVFSNSNGFSFGLNGSTVTGSYTVPTQTNQTLGIYGSSQTTGQSSSSTYDARSLTIRGAGIISVGNSGGEILISASAAGAADGFNILAAGTQTAATNTTVVFSDSNGISFGMSGSSRITASYTVPSIAGLISAVNLSAGTTSNNLSAFVFSNSNSVSFGLNGSTVTASVLANSISTATTVSAVSNANAVGTNSGRYAIEDHQHAGIAAFGVSNVGATAGNTGTKLGTIVLSGGQSIKLSQSTNNSGATIGVSWDPTYPGAQLAIYAGTANTAYDTVSFVDSNGITFGGDGGLGGMTITAKAERRLSLCSVPQAFWGTNFSISNGTFSFQHMEMPHNLTATQIKLLMDLTGNSNSSGALTMSVGFYTMSGSTASLATSASRNLTWTSGNATSASSLYGGVSGTRYRTMAANVTMSPGDYLVGVYFLTTNNGTWKAFGPPAVSLVGAVDVNETQAWLNGTYTASFTTAMPASINITNTDYARTGAAALRQPGLILAGSF